MNDIAGKKPKCPECEYQIDKDIEEHIVHSKKTYHVQCFKQFERRKEDRSDLHNYICELYRIDFPTVYMLKQIKDFQTEYNYTLKGIHLALVYFHEVKEHPIDGKGIGIVPYIYTEARNYYIKLSEVNQHNMNIEFDNTVEIIYTTPPKQRKLKLIDLEEI